MRRYILNPIEPVAVQYTGKTVWRSIPRQVKMGDRIIIKKLRLKLAHNAVLQAMPKDLTLENVPLVTRGKQYTWIVPKRMVKIVMYGPDVSTRITATRRRPMPIMPIAANPKR